MGVKAIGIYSEFVPVHVQVSDLRLVPEGEIIILKLPGQTPVTVYHIGPGQIKMVEEYFAQISYSPWAKKTEIDQDLKQKPQDFKVLRPEKKRRIASSVAMNTPYTRVAKEQAAAAFEL